MADLYGLPSADDEALKSGDPSIGKQILFGLLSSALGTNISAPRGPSVAERLAAQKYGDEHAAAQLQASREAEANKDLGVLASFKAREAEAMSAPQTYVDTGREDKSTLSSSVPETLGTGPINTLPRFSPVGKEIPVEGIAEQSARSDLATKSDLDAVSKFNLLEDAANKKRDYSIGFANAPFDLSAQSKSVAGINDAIKIGQRFGSQGEATLPALISAVDKSQAHENMADLYGIKTEAEKERDRLRDIAAAERARIMANSREQIEATKASAPKEEKVPTADQASSATYAFRMQSTHDKLMKMQDEGFDPASIAGLWYKRNWNNLIKDPTARQYAANKRNFINAVLRKESGAAIAPSEFLSADIQYFPQVGDDANTVLEKDDARLRTIAGMRSAAGDIAYQNVEEQYRKLKDDKKGGNMSVPSEVIVNGYRFKGGDKKNPANWEKVQ